MIYRTKADLNSEYRVSRMASVPSQSCTHSSQDNLLISYHTRYKSDTHRNKIVRSEGLFLLSESVFLLALVFVYFQVNF